MKVEIKENVSEIKFPRLMRSKRTGQIVLFLSIETGVVIEKKESSNNNFEYKDNFENCDNLDRWIKFEGEITLRND